MVDAMLVDLPWRARCAVHEAGHAIVARVLGVQVVTVSINNLRNRYRANRRRGTCGRSGYCAGGGMR